MLSLLLVFSPVLQPLMVLMLLFLMIAGCWLSHIPKLKMTHCYRKANRYFEALAKSGANQALEFVIYSSPPPFLAEVFCYDFAGLYLNRPCPESISLS